jgi:hypothetical protein
VTDDWWHEPEPEPDGWTRGEWLAVLVLPFCVGVVCVVVWVVETLYARGE